MQEVRSLLDAVSQIYQHPIRAEKRKVGPEAQHVLTPIEWIALSEQDVAGLEASELCNANR